jgi:hypothetical protein
MDIYFIKSIKLTHLEMFFYNELLLQLKKRFTNAVLNSFIDLLCMVNLSNMVCVRSLIANLSSPSSVIFQDDGNPTFAIAGWHNRQLLLLRTEVAFIRDV